ncbi:MAG: hypothetical protein M0P12_00770 [Paludibacteraceae bacterium]|nr:hypothetical protein [Paludibacteraceae bacterium]
MLNDLVNLLEKSRFREYAKLFLFANKSSYVSLRVYESYADQGDGYEQFKKSALKNCSDFIDKSIRTLDAIKREASGMLPKVYAAAFFPSQGRNEILKAAQYFVRIEKAWESLEELIEMMKRDISNMEESGKEKVAKEDAINALRIIVGNSDAGIKVLSSLKSRIESLP